MDGDDTDAVAAALAALVRSNGTPMAPPHGGASPGGGLYPAVDAPVQPAGYGGPDWTSAPAGAGGRDDDDDDANSFDELVAEEVARHSGTGDGIGGVLPGGDGGEDALPPLPSPTAPSPLDDAEEYPPPSAPPSDGACSDGEEEAGGVPAYAATGLVRGVNTSLPPLPVIEDTVVVPHEDPLPAAASSPALPVEASPMAHDPPFVPHVATSPQYARDQSSSSSASSSVALPAAQAATHVESRGYKYPSLPPFPPVAGNALAPPLGPAAGTSSRSPPAAAPGASAVGPPSWPVARAPSWQAPPSSMATATLAHLLSSFSALTSRSVLNHDVLRAYVAHARVAVRVVAPYWRRALVRALLFGNGIVALRDAVAVATTAIAAHPLSRAVTARWAAAHDRVVTAAIVVLALAIRTTADAARRAMAVAAEGVAVHTPRLAATLSRLADAGGGGLTTMGAMSLGKLRLRVQVQPTMTPPLPPPPPPPAGGSRHGGGGEAAAAASAVPPAVESEVRLPPTWLRSLNSSLGGSERRRSARKRASIELSGLTDEGRKGDVW